MVGEIVIVLTALVAQAAKPAEKVQVKTETPAATAAKLKDAGGCCRTAVMPRPTKPSRRSRPRRRKSREGSHPLSRSRSHWARRNAWPSQGDYVKAIDELKAAAAEEPKNADLPARLANSVFDSRRLAGRRVRRRPGPEAGSATTCWLTGSRLGCSSCEASSTRRSPPANGSSIATTKRGPRSSRIADALLLVGQAAERYYRASPRGGAERCAERRHQRDLRSGAAGRPQLLASPLAGRAAVSLGL